MKNKFLKTTAVAALSLGLLAACGGNDEPIMDETINEPDLNETDLNEPGDGADVDDPAFEEDFGDEPGFNDEPEDSIEGME